MAKTENTAYGEIEIGLHRAQPEAYEIELRVTNPETQGEIAPERGRTRLALDELMALQLDPAGYGHGGAYSTNLHVDPQHGLVTVFMVQNAGWRSDAGRQIEPAFRAAATQRFGRSADSPPAPPSSP